jgi:hypothetical protein
MKKLLLILLIGFCANAYGQQYSLEKSLVSFFSDAAIEDITAKNIKSASIYNSKNDSIVFSIPIKEFKFAKSLMQEHFNEKYMESDKFKVSTFVGAVKGVNHEASGSQQVKATGKLTIHGVTKDVEIPGTIEIAKDKVVIKSKFNVKLEDYSIARPQILWQNIAEVVEVSVDFTYKPYEKK